MPVMSQGTLTYATLIGIVMKRNIEKNEGLEGKCVCVCVCVCVRACVCVYEYVSSWRGLCM